MSSVITAHSVPAETPPGGAAGSARAPNDAAFDDLFDFLAREAMREVGADRCSIFVLDEERQELWSRVALGIERQVIRFPSNRGIAGFVLQTGTQLNIPKPYDDPRFNQAVDRQTGYRTQSILCAPLRVRDGRIIGVLQVLNKLGGGPFTDLDERTFKRIAHRCALALENALYHEHLLTQKSSDELHRSLKGRSLRVFLCHSSSDKPAVRSLYRRLADEEGIQPWLDEEDLLPGQNWAQEILKAVRASDVVVICISEASSNKAGYLQKEIRYALDVADEQPDGTIFLVPLRLEVCEVPERLSQWQWVNYYEARGYERLMRSLRARAATLSN